MKRQVAVASRWLAGGLVVCSTASFAARPQPPPHIYPPGPSGASVEYAVQTSAPMRECVNCTASQMQTMAKNQFPAGYGFVYDLAHNVIREYDVYMDSDCGPQPVPQPGTNFGSDRSTEANGAGTDCGSFKAADPVPVVAADVQDVFNSLHSAWFVNPNLANTAKTTRTDPPLNPRTHQPFDPTSIAWDYPGGNYEDLREYLWGQLATRGSANAFSPGLGDYIYGVSVAINGADIGIGALVHITIDRTTGTIQISICNANGDCAKVEVHVNSGSITNINFVGSFNVDNGMYPSASGATPGAGGHWNFDLGPDASHFGQSLGNAAGYNIPAPPFCGLNFHWGLTIARVNGQMDSATWQCVANP